MFVHQQAFRLKQLEMFQKTVSVARAELYSGSRRAVPRCRIHNSWSRRNRINQAKTNKSINWSADT
jgi:hypothetical protein